MDVIRGACSKDKVGGMVYIREDIVPSMLEWKAIEDDKNFLNIPLNKLIALQASKESTPKMILQISYKLDDDQQEPTKIRLHFNNRPTMNNIKDALQTIVARSRTRVEGSSTPTPQQSLTTPQTTSASATPTPTSSSSSSTSAPSLSDSNLLKNFELQQKLLLEDKNLRNIFTKSVMQFKLSPTIFWSSRINQLRTFALTISQHRGPYNVLSTIKPVATSDNQVNVNVTRDTINEIFEIYPIIKRAFQDLVPQKLSEGEFWSRFFNSKLFRRLRGDKIGINSGRGDAILDKYIYMDDKLINEENNNGEQNGDTNENDEQITKRRKLNELNANHINKFLDLSGNEQDNSQKLGNRPDMTMRYDDDNNDNDTTTTTTTTAKNSKKENEMIILMKNMNKLSSKMMSMSSENIPTNGENSIDGLSANEVNEYEEDLNLHDLNDYNDSNYIALNINTNGNTTSEVIEKLIDDDLNIEETNSNDVQLDDIDLSAYLSNQIQTNEIDLSETFKNKEQDIEKTYLQISNTIKQNFKTFKLINKEEQTSSSTIQSQPINIIPNLLIQEIITYNITIVEFLSHFWKLFLNSSESNSNQLKKIYTSLKNCSNSLKQFKIKSITELNEIEIVKSNEKLKDKVLKDFNSCLKPLEISLDNALNKYAEAVKNSNTTANGNGNGTVNAQEV
ncbi:TFB1 [Candida pseudojiufengensis]|uniref:TFB1 n=1 Tax=Candida pseudojiufengensis TaxID=497109 RepID=UPI002224E5CB|nr:TFB1 [Candida pseudojiufengensis]KAI5965799.1 TFB1 [Candida pseudojiufengensis]